MSEFKEYIVGNNYSHMPFGENPDMMYDTLSFYAKSGDTYLYLGGNAGSLIKRLQLPIGTKMYYYFKTSDVDDNIYGLVKDTSTPLPPSELFGNRTYKEIFGGIWGEIQKYSREYDMTIEERDGKEYYKCSLIVPKKEGGRSKRRGGTKRSKNNKRRSQRRQRRR